MNCSTVDLKAYFLGEFAGREERRWKITCARCQSCREELDRLKLTDTALRSLVEEDAPQRIAFVSDKVFEPRWLADHLALGSRDGLCFGGAAGGGHSGAWIFREWHARPAVTARGGYRADRATHRARGERPVGCRSGESRVGKRGQAEFANGEHAGCGRETLRIQAPEPIWRWCSKPLDYYEKQSAQMMVAVNDKRHRAMRLAAVVLLLCALPFGSMADKPKVNRAMIEAMADSVDSHLRGIWPADPVEVIGLTQGTYIQWIRRGLRERSESRAVGRNQPVPSGHHRRRTEAHP